MLHRILRSAIFFIFCTQNDSLLHFKISDHPSYRLYFLPPPPPAFWNLKKKKIDLPICPPTPTSINEHSLSRGENRLLLLGRAESSNLFFPVVTFRSLRKNRHPICKFTVLLISEYFVHISQLQEISIIINMCISIRSTKVTNTT